MFFNKSLFVFEVLCVCFCLAFANVLPEKCVTPYKKPGNCVLLKNCTSLDAMSNDFKTPMTLERLKYLIDSQCSLKNGVLTVCCSLEELGNIQDNFL